MSINHHENFGSLTDDSSAEEHVFTGKVDVDGYGPTSVRITGDIVRPAEEILNEAAASLKVFLARESEFRRTFLDTIVTSELMEIVRDGEEDESISRKEVEGTFSNIMCIAFRVSQRYNPDDKSEGYTEIIYEDVEGFVGYDSRIVADLLFTEYRVEEGV